MGTEVLYPQDVLAGRRLGSVPSTASFVPLRRLEVPGGGAGRNPKLRRKRVEGSGEAKNSDSGGHLVMGPVAILRRGESLDSLAVGRGRLKKTEGRRGGVGVAGAVPLEPPEAGAATGVKKAAKARKGEVYAGSAFTQSPSPRALPLPKFSARRTAEGEAAVDQSATRDLLRLLRLE